MPCVLSLVRKAACDTTRGRKLLNTTELVRSISLTFSLTAPSGALPVRASSMACSSVSVRTFSVAAVGAPACEAD